MSRRPFGDRRTCAAAMTAPADPAAPDLHGLVDAYRTHEARVYAVCLRYLRDPVAAQDATQETFTRASAHLQAPAAGKLGAYLASTARNICLNELGTRHRNRRATGLLGVADHIADPEVTVVDRRTISEVWARLSHRDRVLFLYRFAGYSYEDIARRFGIPVNTVRVGLLRARRRARLLLEGLPALLLPWRRRRAPRCGAAWRPAAAVAGGAGLGAAPLPLAVAAAAVAVLVVSSVVRLAAPPQLVLTGASQPAGEGAAILSLGGTMVTGLTAAASRPEVVFASGYVPDCASVACHSLHRSDDGGSTWRRLPARGFQGGGVLVPDAFPGNATLFAAGPQGLQRSDDGGTSFTTVLAVAGPGAITSGGAPGDSTVVVATPSRLLLYSERRRSTVAGASLPRGSQPLDVRLAGDPGHVLVATAGPHGVLLRCDVWRSCSTVLGGNGASVRLASSATVAGDHAVAVVVGRRVEVSTNGGRSFAVASFDGDVLAAGLATVGGRLHVAVTVAAGHGVSLWLSTDGGVSYVPRHAGVLARTSALAVLADGRLLAGAELADAAGRWGVRWSVDGGSAWTLAG